MPQPPRSFWKRAAFTALARVEHTLRGSARPGPQELRQIRNFLVLQYESPLGSIVHASPLFEALKTAMPNAYVAIAASRMSASVLAHNPHIDKLAVTANPLTNFSRSVAELRRILREMPPGPRCVLTTIGNQRTRLALAGLLAGKAVRAGYTLAPELYDIPLTFVPERGQIEGNLDILRALGHEVAFCEPTVFFSPMDATYAKQVLEPFAGRCDAARVAFVTQNSGGQRNQWKAERFQQAIANLSQTCGAVPVFLGTAIDGPAIERLRQSLPEAGISLAGKTTIPQLAAVLTQCDLIVSLDTGTFHVARAVGAPGVVIAPAWQDPREWLPVGDSRYRILQGQSLAAVPDGYCIEEISAEQVVAAAGDLLDRFPTSIDRRAARLMASFRAPR